MLIATPRNLPVDLPRAKGAGDFPAPKLAVVIPCYRVTRHIERVLGGIGPEVSLIYCIDDGCPDGSGLAAKEASVDDPRVRIVFHSDNQGVGAAVLTGYRHALRDGAEIIVKLDGDGQMDGGEIPQLVAPIVRGEADYVKGNRFFNLDDLRSMPRLRLLGNAGLSFFSKLSSGYWNLFDPTNGFTAIHASAASLLPFDKVCRRYFFESDLLFRLNTIRAVVLDVPQKARYADERSHLSVFRSLIEFPLRHFSNFLKRLLYNYFLRDFNAASLNLVVGLALIVFGVAFGATHWIRSARLDVFTSPGTVMLSALPIILGAQALFSFLHFDTTNMPRYPLQRLIGRERPSSTAAGDRSEAAID
jgi:glycosyltransferase involved in cell wall biosynthesis